MSSMSAQSEWNLNQMFGFAKSVQFQKAVEQKKCFAIPILGLIAVYFPDRMNPKDKFGLKAKVPVGHIRSTHPSPGHTLASPSRAPRQRLSIFYSPSDRGLTLGRGDPSTHFTEQNVHHTFPAVALLAKSVSFHGKVRCSGVRPVPFGKPSSNIATGKT